MLLLGRWNFPPDNKNILFYSIELMGNALKMSQHDCSQPTFPVFDPQLGLKPEVIWLSV